MFNFRTLYPRNDYRQSRQKDLPNSNRSKSTKRFPDLVTRNNQSNLPKCEHQSSSSEKSFESINDTFKGKLKENGKINKLEPRQSKFQLIKVIHEFYRRNLQTTMTQAIEANPNNDSDSVKSLPLSKENESSKDKTPRLSNNTKKEVMFKQRMYMYEDPDSNFKYQDHMVSKKMFKLSQKDNKTERSSSPTNRFNEKPVYKIVQKSEKSYIAKLSAENSGNNLKTGKLEMSPNKGPILTPLNCNDRMRKLIAVYGVESQNYLKRSLEKMNKRYPILKPI